MDIELESLSAQTSAFQASITIRVTWEAHLKCDI